MLVSKITRPNRCLFPWAITMKFVFSVNVFLPGVVGLFIGCSGFFILSFQHSFGNCLHNIAFNVGNSNKRRENTRLWMCVYVIEKRQAFFFSFLSFSVYFYVAFVWTTSFKCQRNSITVSNNAWVFLCHLNNIYLFYFKKNISQFASRFCFFVKKQKKKRRNNSQSPRMNKEKENDNWIDKKKKPWAEWVYVYRFSVLPFMLHLHESKALFYKLNITFLYLF